MICELKLPWDIVNKPFDGLKIEQNDGNQQPLNLLYNN